MVWLMAYLSTGAFVGFLAGLLGIGGGMTLVPILATLFAAQGLAPEHTVHLALGTGMASIAFTSGSSVREHHRHTAVDWKVVARMVPGMLLGTLLSTVAAGWISQRALALSFAAIVYSGLGSFVLLKLVGLVIPLRATDADENTGLDVTQHGEEAYIQSSSVSVSAGSAAESKIPYAPPQKIAHT